MKAPVVMPDPTFDSPLPSCTPDVDAAFFVVGSEGIQIGN